nr:amidase family protein [Paenibacillus brasilensis]
MHTSAGSLALADSYATQDDVFVIKMLRAQGAVIRGKTNMTEFGNFMTIRMPQAIAPKGVRFLNPPLLFNGWIKLWLRCCSGGQFLCGSNRNGDIGFYFKSFK